MESPDDYMQTYRELCGPREAIFWLFRDRCVMCNHQATEVNEIIPRSRTKEALLDWRNQVCLCHFCHTEFHKNGVTAEKQDAMRKKREEFLIATGRKEYI